MSASAIAIAAERGANKDPRTVGMQMLEANSILATFVTFMTFLSSLVSVQKAQETCEQQIENLDTGVGYGCHDPQSDKVLARYSEITTDYTCLVGAAAAVSKKLSASYASDSPRNIQPRRRHNASHGCTAPKEKVHKLRYKTLLATFLRPLTEIHKMLAEIQMMTRDVNRYTSDIATYEEKIVSAEASATKATEASAKFKATASAIKAKAPHVTSATDPAIADAIAASQEAALVDVKSMEKAMEATQHRVEAEKLRSSIASITLIIHEHKSTIVTHKSKINEILSAMVGHYQQLKEYSDSGFPHQGLIDVSCEVEAMEYAFDQAAEQTGFKIA